MDIQFNYDMSAMHSQFVLLVEERREESRGEEVRSDSRCLFHLLLQVEYLYMPQCSKRKHWKSFSLALFLSPSVTFSDVCMLVSK